MLLQWSARPPAVCGLAAGLVVAVAVYAATALPAHAADPPAAPRSAETTASDQPAASAMAPERSATEDGEGRSWKSALRASIDAFLIAHAPSKQIDPATRAINPKIGRTPASACEAIRYFTIASKGDAGGPSITAKMTELTDWVMRLQLDSPKSPAHGGVPATPDLPHPSNRYYYAIDAATCADAMIKAHEHSKDPGHLASARRFGEFLLSMQAGPSRRRPDGPAGFCEAVALVGSSPAWNCSVYVKNLVALPPLLRLADIASAPKFKDAAEQARALLVPGLNGMWEFATAASAASCTRNRCDPVWRRVQGPHREPDHFVYGDTLAYALRGFFEAHGPTDEVVSLYRRFAGFKSTHAAAVAYDGRIAFAGYIIAAERAPDHFSAYYDLVTLGILQGFRKAAAPEHFALADAALRALPQDASRLAWRMSFDGTLPASEFIDLTTLANLGEALLLSP